MRPVTRPPANPEKTMSNTNFLSFINSQIPAADRPAAPPPNFARRAVTLSRQAGSGAREVADKLAACLQAHQPAPEHDVEHHAEQNRPAAEHNKPAEKGKPQRPENHQK